MHIKIRHLERTVSNFISEVDVLLRVNHDLLLTINRDDLSIAVRIAGVIDQATTANVSLQSPRLLKRARTQDCPSS
jgi:hypothetical protein